MNALLAALSIYYACDATAAVRPIGGAEAETCANAIPAVSEVMLDQPLAAPGSLSRYAQEEEVRRRMLQWHDAHPDAARHFRELALQTGRIGSV